MIILPPGYLRIFVFHVGSGDQILIQFPNGQYGLIDCYYQKNLGQLEPPALTFLRNLPEEERQPLAFLHISHPDADHVKGLKKLWKELKRIGMLPDHIWLFGGIEVEEYWDLVEVVNEYRDAHSDTEIIDEENQESYRIKAKQLSKEWKELSKIYQNYPKRCSSHVAFETIHGSVGNIGEVYSMTPLKRHVNNFIQLLLENKIEDTLLYFKEGTSYTNLVDKNQVSSMLLFKFGKLSCLFGGDVPDEVLEACMDAYDRRDLENTFPNYHAHWAKGPHHGSQHASSERIWQRIFDFGPEEVPKWLAFSAGMKYTHPHASTIAEVKRVDASIHIHSTNYCLNHTTCSHCRLVQQLALDSDTSHDVTELFNSHEHHNQASEAEKAAAGEVGIRDAEQGNNQGSRLAALVYDLNPETGKISPSIWTIKADDPYKEICICPPSKFYYENQEN